MNITRYIGNRGSSFEVVDTDFLIIGGGIAGLFTALKASSLGQVVVLTKTTVEESNTGLAQGGIAAAVHEADSPFLHLEDTLEAGAGLCNIEAVDVLVREGPERVQELIRMGATFDMKDGNIALAREGAHSKARILHAADATGEAIRSALVGQCEENRSITVIENQFLLDVLGSESGNEIYGALVYDTKRQVKTVYLARATVMAAGGAGHLYNITTNPMVATADGMAACFRAGCTLADMEFIQFHPTVLYGERRQRFLISEAVRGEGAILYNIKGERFMARYHPWQELAPRDVVARAIVNEMKNTGAPYVYLDMSSVAKVTERFPNIYRVCWENGIDICRQPIPVSPAAHYIMGGIQTNICGETNIYGLYACGENACTGVHGANRLASNSLLEGIVFGQRIVDRIKEEILHRRPISLAQALAAYRQSAIYKPPHAVTSAAATKDQLQELMWDKAGIIRDALGLKSAYQQIEQLYQKIMWEDSPSYYETINLLTVAGIVIQAALYRTESRGGHFRSDYPRRDDVKWLEHLSFVNC